MKHFADDWIKEWCEDNGWTDLFLESRVYWAFPPNGVMPLPIPKEVLIQIKADKGFSFEEKMWLLIALSISLVGSISSYFFNCPMPLVFAFSFCAIVFANLDSDLDMK